MNNNNNKLLRVFIILFIVLHLFQSVSAQINCYDEQDCGSDILFCNYSKQICERKEIFPITLQEIIGSILLIVALGLSQAAGIAGSFITIPILILVFIYATKQAIAIGFILMFFSSLTSVVFQIKQKNKQGVPLIDYDLILISLPAISIGATLGTILNKILPEIFICGILISVLLFSIRKSYKQYLQRQEQEQKSAIVPSQQQQQQQINDKSNTTVSQQFENQQYPFDKIGLLVIVLICSLIITVSKGGKGLQSLIGVKGCSTEYWTIVVIQLVVVLLLTILFEQYILSKKAQLRKQSKKQYFTNCNIDNLFQYFILSFVASILGSCIGIGGGVIIMPFWLSQGISQQQASASMTFLIFYNSLEASIQHVFAGTFTYSQVLYFGFIATFASLVIAKNVRDLAEAKNKTSILILLLVSLMSIGMVLMIYISYLDLSNSSSSELLSLQKLC